jgi:hypothetical protein
MRHADGDTNGVTERDSNADGYSHTDTNTNSSCYGDAYSDRNTFGNADLRTRRYTWAVDASHRLSPIGVWSGCG